MPSSRSETYTTTILQALNPWLAEHAPAAGMAIALEKIGIGQSNPTYRLVTDQDRFILRMQPPGELLPSAHAVDREYRVMDALAATAVPVPRMIALCTDIEVIGVKFFIMEHIAGSTIMDPGLGDLAMAEREGLYLDQVDILAELARLDPAAIGLDGFGRPSGYLGRQIAIWTKQYRASETGLISDMEYLMETLPGCIAGETAIDEMGLCVLHGDFRLDNLIINTAVQCRITALIDWELSTLGPPFVDLSYWCAMLRMSAEWPIGGLGGVDRATLGIPDEAALIGRFCTRIGLQKPHNWEAWIAFQLFRFSAILQGVKKRWVDGNASASNAAEVGGQAVPVAELGARTLRAFLNKG